MSESREKTVESVTPLPQEASLARLKHSLESARRNAASALSDFLAERFSEGAPEAVPGQKPLPAAAYELGHVIARGGMGAIISARDNSIQRTVALKVILSGVEASDEHIHRLITEARITGQLEHPNIVPLHELGVTDDGVVYYTMRLVEGVTLSEVLEMIRQKDKRALAKYPLRVLLTIFQKTCDAVAFAHSRGVIHRDLKPDNIMLGEFGEVFVMDWGLAKRLRQNTRAPDIAERNSEAMSDPAPQDSYKTLSGQVKGTPRYMAPEQAEGRVEDIDERTDIYALGAILYTILTLHPPVGGESVNEVLTNVVSGAITPPTNYNPSITRISRVKHPLPPPKPILSPLDHCPDRRIPAALSAVVMKSLTRDKSKRYQTVAELQQDISAYQGGFATAAEGASAFRLLLLLVRRHRTEFVLIGLSLVMMMALAVTFTRKVTTALTELKETAPSFYAEAKTLVDEVKFAKALTKVNYAIHLQPDDARFHALRGNILQSMFQFAEAREAYERALELEPALRPAADNLKLCEKILLDNAGRATLRPESLADLRVLMSRQQRSAEALAVATRESRGAQATFESWRALTHKLGLVGAVRREGGGILLSVQQPEFNDLAPFRTAPLVKLFIRDTQVDDLGPLRNMPLTVLDAGSTRVADISALKGMPLHSLDISRTRVSSLESLRGMQLGMLNLAHTRVSDLGPLKGMPVHHLQLEGCTNLTDFSALAECRQLEGITLPVGARNLEPLKQLPKLRRIGYSLPEGGWEYVPLSDGLWKIQDPRANGK